MSLDTRGGSETRGPARSERGVQGKKKKNEGTTGQRSVPYSAVTEVTALGWQIYHPDKYRRHMGWQLGRHPIFR